MRRFALFASSTLLLLVAACGGSTADPEAPAPAPSPDGGAGGEGSGGPRAWEPGPDSAPHAASIGPIQLDPGEETTVCVTLALDNPDPMYVTRITGKLAEGSHHLILYKSSETEEQRAPHRCSPFSGILNGTVPLMIVERREDQLVFPKGVGLKLDAKQMVRLEAHYINTSTVPLEGHGTMTLDGTPVASVGSDFVEGNLAFWGNTRIHIPPNGKYSTGQAFQSAPKGVKGFAVTTHQHRLGTRMQIWYTPDGDPISPAIADTTNWAEPPLYQLNPELPFPDGAGLTYQCDWNNTTSSEIGFGESALEEMCFLWMYYYPSQGFDICFDGLCPTRK